MAPFSSPSPPEWRRLASHLRAAWEGFVRDGVAPPPEIVRPAVFSRWRTARAGALDPALARVPVLSTEAEIDDLYAGDPFAEAGRRVLDDMTDVVSENAHTLLLSDARGCVLHLTGEPEVTEAIRDLNLRVGGWWDEGVAGPNGIGTALRCRAPTILYGAEHFCERWHRWVCYGAPVHDPVHGGVLGAVNLTGWAERARVNQLPLAISLARSIEYLLAPVRASAHQRLLDAAAEARERFPGDAVLVVDAAGHVVGEAPDALARLARGGVRPADLLREPALRGLARPGGAPAEADLRLAGGLRVAARSVRHRGRHAGTVLVIREAPAPRERRGASAAEDALAALGGDDPAFREALRLAGRAATSAETVLLVGETGTGKELLARAVHALGPRASRPLVALNCAALPRELAESELFGYERGAFTGAERAGKPGRFELADGGTLFLDEVSELPLDVQGKLLRALDERAVFPLGARRPRAVDVRIVAATNRDLEAAVAAGTFRLDLYHRLSVLEIVLPPLRRRRGDVPALARRFLAEACARLGKPVPSLGAEAERILVAYRWPGNVRELRNVAAHLAHWCDGGEVGPGDLPARLLRPAAPDADEAPAAGSLRGLEREMLERTLAACGGNATEAARRLGIHRSTIYRRRGSG